MFTATIETGASVTWDDGVLTGDEDLIRIVNSLLAIDNPSVMFAYWGEREAALTPEFTAYVTVGYALRETFGYVVIEPIPDNPDGYEEEGAIDSEETS